MNGNAKSIELGQLMKYDDSKNCQNAMNRNAKSIKLGQLMKSDNISKSSKCNESQCKIDRIGSSDEV